MTFLSRGETVTATATGRGGRKLSSTLCSLPTAYTSESVTNLYTREGAYVYYSKSTYALCWESTCYLYCQEDCCHQGKVIIEGWEDRGS